MNSRLMKYMASTRPTVRKKYWRALASISGCRAMAAMVCEPARPSPTAAPIAPPPSARPPPMRAPATRTAPSMFPVAMFPLLCRDRVSKCSWSVRWPPGASVLVLTHAHTEVHDGQEGEDERLNGADEQLVEGLPDGQADLREVGRNEGHDDRNHQHAREDVAEESEGQRDGLGDLFNDVDRGEGGVGLGVVLEVAAEPTCPDRGVVHREKHNEGEGQREVDGTRRGGQESRVAAG